MDSLWIAKRKTVQHFVKVIHGSCPGFMITGKTAKETAAVIKNNKKDIAIHVICKRFQRNF